MELNKKKYKRNEVRDLLIENSSSLEQKLEEQKTRIVELIEENERLTAENSKLKEREGLIDKTLLGAQKSAKEQEEATLLRYELAVERLKKFFERWEEYFDNLKDKYPLYKNTQEATEIFDYLSLALKIKNKQNAIENLDKKLQQTIENSPSFNPKKKIQEFVSATSENGFNLDEVLNPGELHLEDICKELGLIDE